MRGDGPDELVVHYDGSGTANRRFAGTDERGSVISLTDGSGGLIGINTYDEYGKPGASNVGRFQYTGQMWLSEIGAYYYKARVYLPHLGVFAQTDPIGSKDSPNLYAYVRNDPINSIDRLGTFTGSRIAGGGVIYAGGCVGNCVAAAVAEANAVASRDQFKGGGGSFGGGGAGGSYGSYGGYGGGSSGGGGAGGSWGDGDSSATGTIVITGTRVAPGLPVDFRPPVAFAYPGDPNSIRHIEHHLTMLNNQQKERLKKLIIQHILTNYSKGTTGYIDTVVIDGMEFEFRAQEILDGRLINVGTIFRINE